MLIEMRPESCSRISTNRAKSYSFYAELSFKLRYVPRSIRNSKMYTIIVFSLVRAEEELAELYNLYFQDAVTKRGLRDPNDPR
jgi:hypothetical protein